MDPTESDDRPAWRVVRAEPGSFDAEKLREFAFDVLEGLSERPKRLSARWLYDDEGSALFARIMDVPQYYPTDCEREILERYADQITAPLRGAPFHLVDLGAGDGRKTLLLLEPLVERGVEVTYVPIDISEGAIEDVTARMREALPTLTVRGLVAEYTDGLRWLQEHGGAKPSLVLFLGSNIGNLNRAQARAFLRRLWSALRADDRVLIGFDLKKDIDLLLSAYNDPQGVTAAFNLNLLARINRELGADFDLAKFRHFGTYNVFSGAMESYLVSLERQKVHVPKLGLSFAFDPWEPIHTEYSYKYLPEDIGALAHASGFAIDEEFTDRRSWFVDALFRAEKR